MKRFCASLIFIMLTSVSFSQNVGVGTNVPSKPLTVRTSGIGIRQEDPTGTYGIGFYASGSSTYLQTHNASDLLFATNDSTATMVLQRGTGNFGIGTFTPTARLNVNGTVRITDGTEADGKVLTSDATGNATWKTQAYGVKERFNFFFQRTNTTGYLDAIYNYGTATVTYTSPNSFFTINITKPGLYHFDFNLQALFLSTDQTGKLAQILITKGTDIISRSYNPFYTGTAGSSSYSSIDKTMDVHFNAAGPIKFTLPFTITGASDVLALTVSGHFVAD